MPRKTSISGVIAVTGVAAAGLGWLLAQRAEPDLRQQTADRLRRRPGTGSK